MFLHFVDGFQNRYKKIINYLYIHLDEKYGPYFGPTVIGNLPGEWKEVAVKLYTEKDARNMVRMCESDYLEQVLIKFILCILLF